MKRCNSVLLFVATFLLVLSTGSNVCSQDIVVKKNPSILEESPPTPESQPITNTIHYCKPGAWGELEYLYTYLEAPARVMELINTPSSRTIWDLPGRNPTQLRDLLLQAGMGLNHVELVMQASIPYQDGPDFRLFPPSSVVESMPDSVRQKIYATLRKHSGNRIYISPVIIESGNVREWFKGSDLKPSTIELIVKLSYPLGNSLAFSDTAVVLSQIQSDVEERTFLKALTRTRSLILSLNLTPDSDFDSLQDYWSAGGKNSDIIPLFQSYANLTDDEQIDVANLLPPTPRKYLYTFSTFSMGLNGTYPDGMWTSLNFFEYLPEDRFKEKEYVIDFAKANYQQAEKPYRFGDILVIHDSTEEKIAHASVYIADDIVYTKNGRSLFHPFMLMKTADLLAHHGVTPNSEVEMWRKKSD